jgi:hypothetical protein
MYLCGGECCVVEGDRLVICPVQWNEVIPSEWTALQASRRLRFRRPLHAPLLQPDYATLPPSPTHPEQ